ncbi:calcium-activated chloride channel regulator 4A-like [Watersipora subatra]|uniref:calcium-activated chloride channel regulator 4A-like n=1 Tax=Watersipora subatra TaxID=2589382 RepID=UPI00355BBF77
MQDALLIIINLQATEFCTKDGNGTTHNLLATNLQNQKCDQMSAWEVMQGLSDFGEGVGSDRNPESVLKPQFTVVRKQAINVSTSTTDVHTSTTAPTFTSEFPESTLFTISSTNTLSTTAMESVGTPSNSSPTTMFGSTQVIPSSHFLTSTSQTNETTFITSYNTSSSTTRTIADITFSSSTIYVDTTTDMSNTTTTGSLATATVSVSTFSNQSSSSNIQTTSNAGTTLTSTSFDQDDSSSTPLPTFTTTGYDGPKGSENSCFQDVVCLCLDVSDSMDVKDRITIMSKGVQTYILSYLRNGTAIGIVTFSSSATVHSNMTEITSDFVRERLAAVVPTVANGVTNIEAGIGQCLAILKEYTGGDISNTRILLHTDGEENRGNVNNSIEQVVAQGVTLDTVLFDQGGFLANQANLTGGEELLASDKQGNVLLLSFYLKTADRYCDAQSLDALLTNKEIIIPPGKLLYQGKVYFDKTVGLNAKLLFKYNVPVVIDLLTDLPVTITKQDSLNTVIISIEGTVEDFIDYNITKNTLNENASVIITVTSSPIPGVQPIRVKNRLNSKNIEFSASANLVGYIGVFQGYTPILQLNVIVILEDPSGGVTPFQYYDNGRGGVVVISNWSAVPDSTPPEKITDLVVLDASKETGVITLSWTAPGEDLNIGQVSGYEFGVGSNYSLDFLIHLDVEVILNNVSNFLIDAGNNLQMRINASAITPETFGLPESANISTYYFRIRTYDSNNNYASWSNVASASFVDPATIATLLVTTTTTSISSTTEITTTADFTITTVLTSADSTSSTTTDLSTNSSTLRTTQTPTTNLVSATEDLSTVPSTSSTTQTPTTTLISTTEDISTSSHTSSTTQTPSTTLFNTVKDLTPSPSTSSTAQTPTTTFVRTTEKSTTTSTTGTTTTVPSTSQPQTTMVPYVFAQ